jgi:hypothetical protein
MAEPVTPNVGYTIPNTGDLVNTWGPSVNGNFSLLDSLQGGTGTQVVTSGAYTLPTTTTQNARILLTGTLSGNVTLTVPQKPSVLRFHDLTVRNGFSITVTTGASSGRTQNLPARLGCLFTDGQNCYLESEPNLGEERVYHGPYAPPLWQFPIGQALSRTGFADLFNSITNQQAGTSTSGSATITGVNSSYLGGFYASGPGVPAGATVLSGSTTTIVLSANCGSGSGAGTFVFSPWPLGDGATTFNLPDRRGTAAFAADNMGGTAAGRLTTASIPTGGVLGQTGGNQLLQAHAHGVNDPTHNHTINDPTHNHGQTTHAHGVADPGHYHAVYDPGHAHGYTTYSQFYQGLTNPGGVGWAATSGASTAAAGTGISIYTAATGIGIDGAYANIEAAATGITNTAAATGVTIANAGSGSSQNIPPAVVTNCIVYVGQ